MDLSDVQKDARRTLTVSMPCEAHQKKALQNIEGLCEFYLCANGLHHSGHTAHATHTTHVRHAATSSTLFFGLVGDHALCSEE